MTYNVRTLIEADEDLARLAKSEPKAFKKSPTLHRGASRASQDRPCPEPLKGKPEGRWSHEITKKHHMAYRIYETEVVVLVIPAYGHYDDK